jgi:hypothetical protein
MPRLDHEMGDGAGDGIDDHTSQLTADAITAQDLTPNDELSRLAH